MQAAFQRYSKGPLYSPREFARAESILLERGFAVRNFSRIASEPTIVYERPANDGRKSEQAIIYMGEGFNSGTMFLTGPDGVRGTTVWNFVREHDGTAASRLMKSIRARLFPG